MKKMLLVAAAAVFSTLSYAQNTNFFATQKAQPVNAVNYGKAYAEGFAAKTTAVGDTVSLTHIETPADTNSFYSYVNDTGAFFGINAFEYKGFAERYDFDPSAVTYKVIGVAYLFGGTVQPASTKTVTFHVWSQGPKTATSSPTISHNGFPATSLAAGSMNITDLGIGMAGAPDTMGAVLFPTATGYLTDSFFIGYNITYTWAAAAGDTIGLYSNLDGERTEWVVDLTPGDTVINNVSVSQNAAGNWVDNAISRNIFNNQAIFPVVIIGPGTASTSGLTHKGFTFYGTFPNPASNSTNVKIGLDRGADVTVSIMDMTGRQIRTISANGLAAGDNTIAINTADLAAGQYIALVRTSTGNGIATQITVIK